MSYPQMLTPAEKLATGLAQLNIPDIIVLCGSTRFMTEMADLDRELTWSGHIVLKPGCDMKTEHPLWADPTKAEAGKARLDELHRAKIRLAGGVLVVGDYIGDSTRREIAYARELGKPVTFMHPEVDPGEPDGDPAASEEQRRIAGLCNAAKPGEGHPQTGIAYCTKSAGHADTSDRVERMHGGSWGEAGWVSWGPDSTA